jgi:hypothetical protein
VADQHAIRPLRHRPGEQPPMLGQYRGELPAGRLSVTVTSAAPKACSAVSRARKTGPARTGRMTGMPSSANRSPIRRACPTPSGERFRCPARSPMR